MSEATFKDRVRELRTERFGTQEQFAFHAGVSRASVQNWERGTQVPSIEAAAHLADLLGVSLDYLAGRTDEREQLADAATALADSLVAAERTPPPPDPVEPRRGSRRAGKKPRSSSTG